MRIQNLVKSFLPVVVGVGLILPATCQEAVTPSRVPSLVVQRVDESKLVGLRGNTHFLARAEFDRGLVDPQLPLERMQLVLKRSAEQDAALQSFIAEQIDPNSPNYHHWLEPEEFGRLYGPSDSDVAAVTNWLENHGFRIDKVSQGRVTIEFSGTAQQVQDAFHTEMHNYLVHGKAHIANDRDPQIPEALAPVVTGIASLHDFFPVHQSELGRHVRVDRATHTATPVGVSGDGVSSEFSFLDPNVGVTNEDIGPYDFAAMYNLTPLWTAGITGKGVSIAIAAETDINLTDVATFRTFFGLSKFTGTAKMVLNGADPGTIQGAVVENTLDTEWAGASAPDADVLVVATKGTATSFGGLLSIEYIIDQKLAPVMSGSYGTCEAGLAAAGNANLNAIYQQGSAEGISIFESAGDQGSTGCDNSDATTYPNPAQNGLQVNGFVSSPYVTGVGGTDIVWQEDAYSKYWTANTANNSSAIGYIPEIPWNSTCTDSYLLTYVYTGQTSSEELCNNAIAAGLDDMVRVVGGSGGKSSCLDYTGSLTTCSGAYAKPSWQAGTGVPADKVRDVPDVSLFASSGLPSGNGGSAYLICVSSNSPDKKCDYSGSNIVAQEVGGTSVSSPAMSGIMALVVQKAGGGYQGLANPIFYSLAAKETLSSCNSNTVENGNSCIFYDISTGTNAMPCRSGSLNCVVNTSGDNIGIVSGYSTTTGYDLATGLGSVNAYNLVNAWPIATPTVTLSATKISFPATTVGTASGSQSVTMTNTGSVAVSISSIALSGTNASSFVFANSCGTSLAAGANCSIHGHFAPTAGSALSATITITDNAGNSPQTIELGGTGVEPPILLSATSLSFGSVFVGSSSGSQSVTLTNPGTAPLSVTSIAVTGTDASSFVFANTCGTSVAAGTSCTIHGHFAPAAGGALTASITITDNASTSPQAIALSGTGVVPPVTLSATSLSFGSVDVGSSSFSQSVTVTNTGTAAVAITSITVAGTNASSFVFANTCGTSLAIGVNCTIHGHFAPTVTGALTATIKITDSASTSPQSISLSGTGLSSGPVKLSSKSLAFPATKVGTASSSQSVTITNTGTAALTITSIAVTGTDASSFVFANSCGASLAVGASCTIHGHFAPAATGAMTATVTITDSATGSPQSIALSGTGQ